MLGEKYEGEGLGNPGAWTGDETVHTPPLASIPFERDWSKNKEHGGGTGHVMGQELKEGKGSGRANLEDETQKLSVITVKWRETAAQDKSQEKPAGEAFVRGDRGAQGGED